MENPYRLYDSDPDAVAKATEAINKAIYHAAGEASGGVTEQAWQKIVMPVLHQYQEIGASDTGSREVVYENFLYAKQAEDEDAYPERRHPTKKKSKAFKYYVVYPDSRDDQTSPPFPSGLAFEVFDSIEDAREHAKKQDTGHPSRDFLVIKGTLVGFSLDDAYDAEFLDG